MQMPITIPTAIRLFYKTLEAHRQPHAQSQSGGEDPFVSRQVMLVHDLIGEVIASSPSNLSKASQMRKSYSEVAPDVFVELLASLAGQGLLTDKLWNSLRLKTREMQQESVVYGVRQ